MAGHRQRIASSVGERQSGQRSLGEERLASIAWGADDWGIAIAVSLKSGGGPATVILRLR